MSNNSHKVIVTGAAGGIGSAVAKAFAEGGAQVAALTHNERLASDVLSAGHVTEYRCDLANREEVFATFGDAVEQMGGLNVLMHVAAVESPAPAAEASDEHIDWHLNANIKGTIYTNQAAFRHMSETGGSIVNFTSEAGVRGALHFSVYGATKAAVGGWTRSVAMEWGRNNIRVNCIAPLMDTPMLQRDLAALDGDELEAFEQLYRTNIHLGGKFGEAYRDLAPLMLFLAGEGGRFITGQTLAVDGGYVMLGS